MRRALPLADVLVGDDAALHHFDVFLTDRLGDDAFVGDGAAEIARRVDQIPGGVGGCEIVVEAEAALRQHFAEDQAEEVVEFRLRRASAAGSGCVLLLALAFALRLRSAVEAALRWR